MWAILCGVRFWQSQRSFSLLRKEPNHSTRVPYGFTMGYVVYGMAPHGGVLVYGVAMYGLTVDYGK